MLRACFVSWRTGAMVCLLAMVFSWPGSSQHADGGRSALWTVGFWFGDSSAAPVEEKTPPLDVLFIHTGTVWENRADRAGPWFVRGYVPVRLPAAREFWLVFRAESKGVPPAEFATELARVVVEQRQELQRRHQSIAGIQLDVDSPAPALSEYAQFIRAMRKVVGRDLQISIIALLDWFRDGTGIETLLEEVDEFIPKFYDVPAPGRPLEATFAARIDSAKWGPILNRYRKRFRIGIPTLERSSIVRGAPSEGRPRLQVQWELMPLDLAANSAFELRRKRNGANELVLRYAASNRARVGYATLDPGDAVEFVVATPESVRGAVDEARRTGEYCAGVVFFRWPSPSGGLAMPVDEALAAAGVVVGGEKRKVSLVTNRGDCAAVHCDDLFLHDLNPFHPRPVRYHVESSTDLEYFVPSGRAPVSLSPPRTIEVQLPAFCGRKGVYLGRAVASTQVEFRLWEAR